MQPIPFHCLTLMVATRDCYVLNSAPILSSQHTVEEKPMISKINYTTIQYKSNRVLKKVKNKNEQTSKNRKSTDASAFLTISHTHVAERHQERLHPGLHVLQGPRQSHFISKYLRRQPLEAQLRTVVGHLKQFTGNIRSLNLTEKKYERSFCSSSFPI